MTKLNLHGETVADYVRHSTHSGEYCEVTYRLMSDGVLLQQTLWARSKQAISKSPWKIAKVTPAIKANPDLLLTQGFQKMERYPSSL